MAQQDIKQIRGASQGSILFLGTNSVVSENSNKLSWNDSSNGLNIDGYIDFGTSSVPGTQSGRIYFDNAEEALSYYPNTNQNVVVRIGQQLYLRVKNTSGSPILKGSAVKILTASDGLPNITLAIADHVSNNRVVGLVSDTIQNGHVGLVLTNGLLSGVDLSSYLVGDLLYLSDVTSGGFTLPSSLSFSSRTNEIGYVIDNSSNGKIYVNINNEDLNLTLTNIERNILEGNVVSSGVYEYSPGITKISNTTFSISPAKGWLVRNTYTFSTSPDVEHIVFTGATGLSTPYLNSDSSTYVLLSSTASVILQPTFPTPQQRRESIYLGKVVHPDKTIIQNVNNSPDFDVSPMSALRDLWTPIKLINQGCLLNTNGANLTFQMSGGTLWGNGINWVNDQLNPDSVSIAGKIPVTFQYRTQTGTQSAFTDTTTIDTTKYDVGGVATSISGAQYSNQRVYLYPTGVVRVQYGQYTYTTLSKAITGILTESFQEYVNNRDNGILIGIITVKNGSTDLTNINECQFTTVSKFGELLGGSAGGVSTTNLQGTYDNSSSNPEILTNATLGAVNIRRGSALDTDNVLSIQNGAGTDKIYFTGDGKTTTQTLTISALTATSSSLSYVVVDGSGDIYKMTGITPSLSNVLASGNTTGNQNILFPNNYGVFNGSGVTSSSGLGFDSDSVFLFSGTGSIDDIGSRSILNVSKTGNISTQVEGNIDFNMNYNGLGSGTFTIYGYSGFGGVQYSTDYSANYTDRSLVDKGYVNSIIGVGSTGATGATGATGSLSITGTTDNGIITLNGSSPNVTAESNLTFDGSTMSLTGNLKITGTVSSNVNYISSDALIQSSLLFLSNNF